MSRRIAVVEPPFLEPSLPRPEVRRVARLISDHGRQARVVDANLALYQALLAEPVEAGPCRGEGHSVDAFAEAFSVDVGALQAALAGGGPLPGDIPEVARAAFLGADQRALRTAVKAAVARLSGGAEWLGHGQYIRDVQLLDAILDNQMRACDHSARLSLHAFGCDVDITIPAEVLAYARDPDNPLSRLFDRHLDSLFQRDEPVLVVISEEPQLLPGLALCVWLRSRYGVPVTVTGDHLDSVLSLHFPSLTGMVDTVVAHRFEHSGAIWLQGEQNSLVVQIDQWNASCSYPRLVGAEAYAHPGLIPVFRPEGYLSPLPLVGGTVTSRCYWSRCGFCGIAAGKRYPFRHVSSQAIVEAFRTLAALGVEHVQLFDYAMPPALLRGMAAAGPTGVQWAAQARFERSCLEPGFFPGLAAAGCVALSWGLESASERLLLSCGKGGLIGASDRSRALRASAEAGILNCLFVITGLPGETQQDFFETADWLATNIDAIAFVEPYAFRLRPGTALFGACSAKPPAGQEATWLLDVPHEGLPGLPDRCEAEARAELLAKAFAFLPERARAHDWLEGHLALHRTLVPGGPRGVWPV